MVGAPEVKLLPELEAATLAYGMAPIEKSGEASNNRNGYSDNEEELILIFDLGGGTFDVFTLEVDGGVMEVLATVRNID